MKAFDNIPWAKLLLNQLLLVDTDNVDYNDKDEYENWNWRRVSKKNIYYIAHYPSTTPCNVFHL